MMCWVQCNRTFIVTAHCDMFELPTYDMLLLFSFIVLVGTVAFILLLFFHIILLQPVHSHSSTATAQQLANQFNSVTIGIDDTFEFWYWYHYCRYF